MAGLPAKVTPHVLRHTFATWYYVQTKDLTGLMKRGDWSRAGTAMDYAKLAPSDLGERLLDHGWDFR